MELWAKFHVLFSFDDSIFIAYPGMLVAPEFWPPVSTRLSRILVLVIAVS